MSNTTTPTRSNVGNFAIGDRVIVQASTNPSWPNRDTVPVGAVGVVTVIDNGDDTIFVRAPHDTLGGHWLMAVDLRPADTTAHASEAHASERSITQALIDGEVAAARSRFAEQRNEQVLNVLTSYAEDGEISEDSLDRILSSLGIERPETERVVEVTVSTTYRVTIRGTSSDGRRALRDEDLSYIEQSVHYCGDGTIDGDGDITVLDIEESDAELSVNTVFA